MGNVKLLPTACLIVGAGCAAERAPDADLPTWEEYRDTVRREFEGHVSYVLDGDEPTTLDELRALRSVRRVARARARRVRAHLRSIAPSTWSAAPTTFGRSRFART